MPISHRMDKEDALYLQWDIIQLSKEMKFMGKKVKLDKSIPETQKEKYCMYSLICGY